jgi:hypothetical protein
MSQELALLHSVRHFSRDFLKRRVRSAQRPRLHLTNLKVKIHLDQRSQLQTDLIRSNLEGCAFVEQHFKLYNEIGHGLHGCLTDTAAPLLLLPLSMVLSQSIYPPESDEGGTDLPPFSSMLVRQKLVYKVLR